MNTESPAQPSPPAPRPRSRVGGIALLLLALLLGGGYWYDTGRKPTLVEGPLLQLDGTGRVNVVWKWTPESIPAALRWTDSAGTHDAPARAVGGGRVAATLTDLPPGRSATYTLVYKSPLSRQRELGNPHTCQAPAPRGKGFRVLAFGDSGGGGNSQFDLAELMLKQGANLVIHTGDLIYPAGDDEDYALKFYEPYARLIDSVPFMPSLGNHDCATDKGAPYLNHFALPENGPPGIEPERNYWFDYGDARFVALDTNRASELGAISFEQMKTVVAPWLRRVLTCDAKWKFVFFHHPPYTGSVHEAKGQAFVKEAFCPIFDETHVDLVLCGHNHLYERTAPILGDKVVPDGQGTVYVTTGAGGASQYPEALPPPPYIRVYNDKTFNFTLIDITPDRAVIRQVDETGKTFDEFTLAKPPVTESAPSATTGSPAP